VYNASKRELKKNVEKTIRFFNAEIDRTDGDTGKIKRDQSCCSWTVNALKALQQKRKSAYRQDHVVCSSYRPFEKQWLYFDRDWVERPALWAGFIPTCKHKNIVICISGATALVTDVVPNLHFCGDVQAFPLYWYEKIERKAQMTFSFEDGKDDEYVRHDGVSDFILKQFQHAIGPKANKEDIFYFVYAALHHRGYRETFAADLKKQLPRLPVPTSMDDYKLMVKVGRDLAALHLHYEDIEGYGLKEVKTASKVSYEVKKLAWGKKGKEEDRTKIIVNETLTLEGIPAKAHEYVVNGRSGLEWIIERYQLRTDTESGITNDPNDWGKEHGNPRYIVDLIQSVTAVSVQTADLVDKLAAIQLRKTTARELSSEVVCEIAEELKYNGWLPVYSLRAACGPLADGEEVSPDGWVKVEGHGKLDDTQFVVKTEGVSMEGLIPEGSAVIFRKLGGGDLEGKTILVQCHEAHDPESGGAYTVKRFTRKGDKVILKAKNPKYDIVLRDEAEYSTKYRALAEFRGVL